MSIPIPRILLALPALTLIAFNLHASELAEGVDTSPEGATRVADAGRGETYWLDPMQVTATLTERRANDSLNSVSVVGRESIRRQQPRQFSELLRGRPGVDAVGNGAFGKATSLFIRGASNNQTLLLVDGIRMGSATTGGASWQFLPPRLIDRVEIVRGPRGSVYGADAIGGVVQVFTPEGEGEPEPWAELAGGSFSTGELGAGVSGSSGDTHYSLGASHFQTDGIALRPGGERKAYDNSSVLGRVRQDWDNGGSLGVTGLRSEGRTEFIGGETDYVQQALGASLNLPLADAWDSIFSVGESRDENDNLSDTLGKSRFDTRRRGLRWQNTLHAERQEYVIGVDHLDDRVEGTTDYEESSRYNIGVFAQGNLDLAPVSLEAGIRHDDNEAFGSATTGSLAGAYRLSGHHRARLTYGEGFRAPTFNELYFPGFGNPDLSPEQSSTIELAVRGRYARWFWEGVAYRTDIDDLIETVSSAGLFEPRNVASARIRGLEFSLGAELGQWTLYGAASYSDPENRETGNRLRRRARESLRLELDRALGDWSLGATVVAQGARYDDDEQSERLAGFALLNLRLGWRFGEAWSARLTVDNALDKDYVTARDSFNDFDYQQPGRSVFLSLRYGRD